MLASVFPKNAWIHGSSDPWVLHAFGLKEAAMSKRALVIVDMLNDFVHEKGTLYCGKESEEIIPLILSRLQAFRERGDTVIHVQDSHDTDDREFERYASHAVVGTWGNGFTDSLKPAAGEYVVPKKTLSSFYGTDLEGILEKEAIAEVEVVGVCTSICVMDTVGGLVNRGHSVSVPAGEVADFDQEAHAFALKRMRQVYGADVS